MEGYRGILLEPVISRTMSRSWRRFLEKGLQNVAAPMQWGGRSGVSIEGVHLQVKLWQNTAHQERKSLGLLFVDLRSAFYSVVKPMLAIAIRQIFQRLRLPETAFDEFCENVFQARLVKRATNSDILEQFIAAMLKPSWFLIQDSRQVSAPTTGSRPGDPVADLLFGFLVARILAKVESACNPTDMHDSQELHHQVANSVAWVDDMVFRVACEADQLMQEVAKISANVIQICAEHGFSLAMGANKTAVIMEFRGRGATAARQKFEQTCKTHLHVVSEHHGVTQIPVVSFYKHLGSYVVRNGSLQQEVRMRAAQSFAKIKPLLKITKNQCIDVEKRRLLVKTMAKSVLTLHTGSGWNMGITEFHMWQAAVHRLYTATQPRNQDGTVPHTSHYEAAMQMQSPMAMELLHISKLRLLAHLLREGDIHIHAAILHDHAVAGDQSWLAATTRSLTWMQDQIGREDIHDDFWKLDTLDAWSTLVPHVRRFKKLIHHAAEAHMWRVRVHCELEKEDREQRSIMLGMGCIYTGSDIPEEPVEKYACSICDQTFDSPAAVAVHEARKHQCRIAMRRIASDCICRVCGRCYHTRVRLLQHWHYGTTKCWYKALRAFEPMTPEATADLDDQDREQGMAFHQHTLKTREKDYAWRLATPQEMQNGLPHTGNHSQEAPSEEELQAWRQLGLLPVGQGGRQSTQRQPKDFSIPNVAEDTQTLERRWVADLKNWDPNLEYVPFPLSNGTKYVLLLFSGHRRVGDTAYWLQGAEDIQPIPIDLAIDSVHGNILQSKLWVDLIRGKRVLGSQAGPPCETFTEARWLPPPEGHNKPRPLRCTEYPWGQIWRTLKEVKQASIGSILLVRTLSILLLTFAHGGATVMEHPKGPPEGGERWTAWHSAMVKRMLKLAGMERIDFLQGPLGQPFSKPTVFMAGNMPLMAAAIYSNYMPHWRPTMKLGGKDSEGKQWTTAAAKAYPPLLCKILAEQFQHHANQMRCEGTTDLPQELDVALSKLCCWDPYVSDPNGMHHDYDSRAGEVIHQT